MTKRFPFKSLLAVLLSSLLPMLPAAGEPVTEAAGTSKDKKLLENADAHLNLAYLPDWRYSGDKRGRRDDEMLLDLWVPKGAENCALVMYCHGGTYGHGTKNLGPQISALAERVLGKGMAFASLNYILLPKGIRPQVWYDYRDAARYLRIHSKRFRLDPTRFGSFGSSAGGWLITSAGHGTGDHFSNKNFGQGVTLHDIRNAGFAPLMNEDGEDFSVWTPMQSEQPGYPGVYGNWQAIAFDLKHFDEFATSGSPAMLQLVGEGYMPGKARDTVVKGKYPPLPTMLELAAAGTIDYSYAYMTDPKFAKKSLHVPPMTGEHTMTKRVSGEGEAELAEVVAEWFDDRLNGDNARAPVPEISPAMRVIDGPREVSIVVPSADITVHFTTDGSEPTSASPTYSKPFSISGDTTIKAISMMANRKPSGAAIATFVKGPPPPSLTLTERVLPPAKTGQPYSFTFAANQPEARYWLYGDLAPRVDSKTKKVSYANGMQLDSTSGVFSGTPTTPGKYWIQIAVQSKPGMIARVHDFTWEITGAAIAAPATPTPKDSATDTNITVLQLKTLPAEDRAAIQKACTEAGVDLVINEDGGVLLIVPAEQKATAKSILSKHFGQKLPAGANWVD
jgi:Chitobiase/beta-hexosaminidase C-terminal domain/alpha/beta hydrolase fold